MIDCKLTPKTINWIMRMRTINKNWIDYFKDECKQTKFVRIISPFISLTLVNHLLEFKDHLTIQLITRFNLNDLRQGVSSLQALRKLLDNGVQIKGIKDLHSKVYLFEERSAIIASANFTSGGFFNNYEYGIISDESDVVCDSLDYFNSLWNLTDRTLTQGMIDEWSAIISQNKVTLSVDKLKDYGVSRKDVVIGNKKVFVKFFGISHERSRVDRPVKEIIDVTHSHFAATFPEGKGRPKRYNDGDIIYMAYMTNDRDYAIFGKAVAIKHNRARDVASSEDILIKSWKKRFNIYVRVHSAKFLNTDLKNCPKLWSLMNDLQAESFRSTKIKYDNGEDDIQPQKSLMRQADIELSTEGALWLDGKFKEVEERYGLVDEEYIDSLYPGSPSTKSILAD